MNRKQRRAQKDTGPVNPSPEVAQIFAAAAQYHQAGRLAEAEQLYRRVLAVAPRHADSLHRLGLIAYQAGRPDFAVDLLRQAITQDRKAARYHAHLSLALGALGQLEEAVTSSRLAIRLEPNQPDAHNNLGVLLMQLGRLEGAADCYRQAIALEPGIADPHNNLGNVLMGLGRPGEAAQSYRQALMLAPDFAQAQTGLGNALLDLGQADEALLHHRQATELQPNFADAHNNLGNALWKLGRLEEAATHFRSAIGINPDFVLAYSNLGGVLKTLGRPEEAVACFQQALQRMPDHPGILNNLALTLLALGDSNGAMGAIIRSLALQETAESRKNFVACVKDLRLETGADALRPLLLRALRENWDRPGDLARIAADVIKSGQPGLDALAKDELLHALLVRAPNVDMGLERFLTGARRAILDAAQQGLQLPETNFANALAQQCFINEYVFPESEYEAAQVRQLRDELVGALEIGKPVSPSSLVAIAAYLPLSSVPLSERLLKRDWPAAVEAILTQQIREPRQEVELRAAIPRLTSIENAGSRLVQSQYEENPYPRWVTPGAVDAPEKVTAFLRQTFPFAEVAQAGSGTDILVAGCGTGRNAIETARKFKDARMLAVDLSLNSLVHALRKSRELGVEIEYAQADILELGALERRFDLIEAIGVLHHLADPFAGWRVLISLLRPGGVMKLGFYSAVARRGLPDLKTDAGVTADAVRAVRQALAERDDEQSREALGAPDFYSISSCRDLLFHVQERRLTLAEIDAFLRENNLKFLGFATDDAVIAAYRRRFPDDAAAANLAQWQDFENENPDTFAGMYQFWVQKV